MKYVTRYLQICFLYLKKWKPFLLHRNGWAFLFFISMLMIFSGTVYTDSEKFSLDFDGSDMKAEDQDAGGYINGLSEITVSMWVKSNEINTDKGFLNGGRTDSKDDQLVMRYDKDGWGNTEDRSNTIKIGFTIDGVEVNANASSSTQTTDWQHVVMTWSSGNNIKLYIDGVRDTGLKIASSNADGLSPSGVMTDLDRLVLGKGPKDSKSSWNGNIDDFYLFGRAITSSEVTQLYNKEKTLNSDTDLLTYYPMDTGSGNTLEDSSGNNHDAAINGATWQANEYTLSFDSAGGSKVNAISQEYNTNVTLPDDPTREGYTFTGWDKTVPDTMPAEDRTYTAQWEINQYTLTFDSAGGSTVNSITQDYDTNITAPDDPIREGYTFTGWDKTVPETMPAGDQTYTAQWKINQYTLTFDSAGGSTVNSITQDYDTAVTVEDPTKEGYTFTGWDKTVPETMPAGDQTYTAQWEINQYTVTYDGGGSDGGANPMNQTVDYNTDITLADNTFTRTGYTFDTWNCGQEESTYTVSDNVTCTAQWKANEYTLTFDSAGGSTVNSITQDYDTNITTPDDPTREGYTFTGWDKTVPETMPAGDRTYTAQWEINQYTLTFDSAGGTKVESITQDYNTDITVPDNPTRKGYTFTGWDERLPDIMPARDQTYTAQWKVFVPVISELDVISTPTSNSTPSYSFISSIAGTITYYGDCKSSQSQAQSGVNTITFNPLSDGIYTDCALTVTHANGTLSNRLDITEFTIDTTSTDNKEDEAQDEQGSSEEGEEQEDQENTSDQDEEESPTPQDNSNNNNEDGEDLEPIEVDNEEQGSSEEGEGQQGQEDTLDQDEEESPTPQNTESDNQENRGQTSEQRFEEPQAPNNGDGNNDGIQDSEQPNVANYLNQVTTSYNTMTVNEEENNQIRSLRSVPESDVGNDERHVYPMGLYEFTVDLDKPGDTADVTIYTDQVYDTDLWEYRKYDRSDNGFTDISSEVTYRTAFNGEQEVTTISYSIVDGGPLDEDGEVNGTIVDPAGPALLNQDVTPPDTGYQPVNLLLYGLVFMTGGGLVTWVFRDKISL